jgi:hypothetical protein
VTAPLEPPRYKVRIEIPRLSGTRGWSAAAAAFEHGVTEHASLLVTQRQIELLTRQGRDYVRVSATVEASSVAEAAVVAWAVLRQAMAEDADGWDTAGVSAEIRPARSARLPGLGSEQVLVALDVRDGLQLRDLLVGHPAPSRPAAEIPAVASEQHRARDEAHDPGDHGLAVPVGWYRKYRITQRRISLPPRAEAA